MRFFNKKVLSSLIVMGLVSSTAVIAKTEEFPNRDVNIVVTFPPGGGTDLLARLISAPLGEKLGQSIIVENRPGASGNIAARHVARSKPDGHTLLMVNSSYAVNPAVYSSMPFDPINDLSAVVNFAYVPSVIIVPSKSKFQTIQEYLKAAEADDNDVFFGSCGNGTPQHMAGELLNQVAKITITHVPYAGCGPAVNDVLANQVSSAIVTASSAMPHIQAGKVRALAVTSKERSEFLTEVPSVAEVGYADYDVNQWHGLLVPSETSQEKKEIIANAVLSIIETEEIQQRLKSLGYTVGKEGPKEFNDIIKGNITTFKNVADEIGLKLN